MKFSTFFCFVLLITSLTSCGGRDARLSGHFVGAATQRVVLERVVPDGIGSVDTIQTNDKGEFSLKIKLPDGQPTLFNLRYAGDMVPLLIAPHERVTVMSLGDLEGYRVSGSRESELVWRLHGIMRGGAKALDSIYQLYSRSSPTQMELQRRAYLDRYLKVKRDQITFIVEHASSLAAIYALYQRLPGDETLSNGEGDIIYYQMVADSVRGRYPTSRYLKALESEIAGELSRQSLVERLNTDGIEAVDHPDIALPDMYGTTVRLSSLAGKVIVLDFWSAAAPAGRINNAEMREMWNALESRGMAIYQVSLDTDKALWVNAVQEQRLPWVTVCDFRGTTSPVVGLYNLQGLPANFVIDRTGKIVGKNLFGDDLRKKVESLL